MFPRNVAKSNILALFLLICMAAPGTSSAEIRSASTGAIGVPQGGLALGLSVTNPTATYRLGSTIDVSVELRNVSQSSIPVMFGRRGEAYRFTVEDKDSGIVLPLIPREYHRPVYRSLGGPHNGWAPGSSDFTLIELNTYVRFDKPGTYDVVASSEGIVDSRSHQHLQLRSNHITIVIVPDSN